ncbi:MAG: MFS transporter [Alphaproteobacteria bacterium]|nr:MFS transporter [Alphaproteobacteria bacterium]
MFGTGPGQSHLIGLFFDPIQAELGLDRTEIALAYGSATLVAALLLPRMGRLVDRHGPANMIWLIALGLGLAAVGFSFATGWLYLAIGFGFLRFLGQGSLMLNCANMAAQWFDKKRGLALGLMALGFPISIALHPPFTQWLIATVGWREAWVWLGVLTWVMLIPPALLFLYNRPEDVGLRPDGAAALKAGERAPPLTGFTKAEALRMPAFYLIVAGMFSLSMLVTSLHVEYTGILKAHGLDPQVAASMFTVSGVTAALLMPLVGRLLDALPTKWMFFGGLWVQSASLLAITFVQNWEGAVVFAMIFGLNNAVTMTYVGYLWPRYFGRKHLGSIQGTGQMIIIFGASIGPVPLGWALDSWGEYDTMLRLLALIPVGISVLVALLMPHPRLPEAEAAG